MAVTEELERQRIQRAKLAIADLLEAGNYDYYVASEMTTRWGWSKYELEELLAKLEQYQEKSG